jgi:hypothetical protein
VVTNKRRFDVLKIDDIYFFVPTGDFEDREAAEFFYQDYTCPTNITRSIEHVVWDGRSDAHGVFEYVGTTDEIDWPTGPHTPDELLKPAFPEAYTASPNPSLDTIGASQP